MQIMGIDCGTERTGYGVINTDGRSHQFIEAGIIRTRTADPLASRLKHIASELREKFQSLHPDIVVVEEVFHALNAKSSLKLAHVRGVALLVAAEAGLDVFEYSPLEIKISVVGYGRAEKQQVQMMVLSLLGINQQFASFDATDALAVAICHATRSHLALPVGAQR